MKTNLLSVLLTICLLFSCDCSGPRYEKYQSEFMGMFDTVTIIVGYAQSEDEFNRYAEIIYNRMEELHRLFDIYNAYDGINNLYVVNQNAGIAPVKVEREVIDVLMLAREGYKTTGGMVDVTLGPVLKIWRDYRNKGIANEDMAELPPVDLLEKAAETTSINDLVIDEQNNTVFLTRVGMSLDVGAVAKGYAAGLVADAVRSAGARSMLLSVGGNVTSIGKPLDNVRSRWGIGIQNPDLNADNTRNIIDTVYPSDATVSCSGGYQRFYVVDGQKYNHVINPKTLMPANLYKQVAVIHADSFMADLLSTALFILPQKEGAALAIESNAEALWVYQDDSHKATEGYIVLTNK